MGDLTFIETQFPVAKLSAESYKEREAGASQTLTGLGKWWGRKPLVLVRAAILGCLLPASADAAMDREIFLRLMTMDEDGLRRRRRGALAPAKVAELAPDLAIEYRGADRARRAVLADQVFHRLAYDSKLQLCSRPEEVDGPAPLSWLAINEFLGTRATCLDELVRELAVRRFGHAATVGDPFSGGGSIPFEAARLGCGVHGSDLNPVAALLTWASIHLVGASASVRSRVEQKLGQAYERVAAEVGRLGIERSAEGWEAEAYLYCVEVKPPGCEYSIPLAPNWTIAERTRVCAVLRPPGADGRIGIDIVENAPDAEWLPARSTASATAKGRIVDPFDASRSWSLEALRGASDLRRWSAAQLVPGPEDVFQERLYCIRWRLPDGTRAYRAPSEHDLNVEARCLALLEGKWASWRAAGVVPSARIPSGYNTDQPTRERGWTHWHHLFTPRQLLVHGLLAEQVEHFDGDKEAQAALLLGVGSAANRDSKLCVWTYQMARSGGIGASSQTFLNQALNPMYNWGQRPLAGLRDDIQLPAAATPIGLVQRTIGTLDARDVDTICDLWITDPPYADAVNYHELGDFFLAWYSGLLPKLFPEWAPDSRAALAVKGDGDDFRHAMVEIYRNLARHMPDNGMQVVMFTHTDPSVWADLGMILWAAGLHVTAAWTIGTETAAAGLKDGNYVQGTVLLVLRKRLAGENGFLDEVYPLVADEVRRQIDSMRDLDDDSDPNFGDTDYHLAAYAAALRVLTGYATIDGEDVRRELFRPRAPAGRGRRGAVAKSRFETVIDRAIEIACSYLVPRGLDDNWATLTADERLYLRAVDIESRGERRSGVYQELARGFGVKDVKVMLQSERANSVRVKTATEFARRELGGVDFAGTALRRLLFAIHETAQSGNPDIGRRYLFDELSDYWDRRVRMVAVLEWLAALGQQSGMAHWHPDAEAARLLAGRLRNDHG